MLKLFSILKIMLLWLQKMLCFLSSKMYKLGHHVYLSSTFSTFLSRFDASLTKYEFSEHFSWRKWYLYIHCKTTFLFWQSPGNCLNRPCKGTFVVSLFPFRVYFPLVDSKDRARAIIVIIKDWSIIQSPSEFPSMSCKFLEDGVTLPDAILFEQARERPLKVNRWLARSRLLSSFESVQMHSVHTSVTEILLSKTKANPHNAFEF